MLKWFLRQNELRQVEHQIGKQKLVQNSRTRSWFQRHWIQRWRGVVQLQPAKWSLAQPPWVPYGQWWGKKSTEELQTWRQNSWQKWRISSMIWPKKKSARKLLQQEVQEGNLKYQQLEGRIAELEHKNAQHHSNVHVDGDDLEHIDKSVVVVGGFNEKTVEEAEALVQQMMVGIAGYKSVEMIDGESPFGLATFDSPIQAMKFIRSQKKNGTIHTNKLRLLKIDHGQNVPDARSWAKSKNIWLKFRGLHLPTSLQATRRSEWWFGIKVNWCLWPL